MPHDDEANGMVARVRLQSTAREGPSLQAAADRAAQETPGRRKRRGLQPLKLFKRHIFTWLGWIVALFLFLNGITVNFTIKRAAGPDGAALTPQQQAALIGDDGTGMGPIAAALQVAQQGLPYSDMLLVIFTADTPEGAVKRALLRGIYDKYNGQVVQAFVHPNDQNMVQTFTLRTVFLVASMKVTDPNGQLDGDVLYVHAEPGYNNIAEMTNQMMSMVHHFDFRYLLKSDDDTFVCLRRLAALLAKQLPGTQRRLYAGVPTACGAHRNNPNVGRVIMDKTNRWYDPKFVEHTMQGLPCYPVYMQGAFYVLAYPLVQFLRNGRDHWITFQNEDVTVGSWLLGVDREIVAIDDITTARLWGCQCAANVLPQWARRSSIFFHDCKKLEQLQRCSDTFKKQNLQC